MAPASGAELVFQYLVSQVQRERHAVVTQTSTDIRLDVEHEEGVVKGGAKQRPPAAALPLIHAHAPPLVVLRLQRPPARTAALFRLSL